jgi:hypothetical protein
VEESVETGNFFAIDALTKAGEENRDLDRMPGQEQEHGGEEEYDGLQRLGMRHSRSRRGTANGEPAWLYEGWSAGTGGDLGDSSVSVAKCSG